MKTRKTTIAVLGATITVLSEKDFICLTDIARVKNADRSDDLVRNWLRNRNTVEFLGIWEQPTTLILIPSNSTELKCRLD